MADGSVAPKERVNIVYKSQSGDQSEDVELPLKLLMLGLKRFTKAEVVNTKEARRRIAAKLIEANTYCF